MGVSVPAPAKDIGLLLREEGLNFFKPLRLGGGGHIPDGGPVQVLGLGFAMEHQPGAHHHLVHPVPQMGKPQGGQGEQGGAVYI